MRRSYDDPPAENGRHWRGFAGRNLRRVSPGQFGRSDRLSHGMLKMIMQSRPSAIKQRIAELDHIYDQLHKDMRQLTGKQNLVVNEALFSLALTIARLRSIVERSGG